MGAQAQSGLTGVRIHDLRHSLASAMINSGAMLAFGGRGARTFDPATTQRYAHVARQALKEALDKATNVIPIKRLTGGWGGALASFKRGPAVIAL